MGCVLGALLAAANTYTALALGFLDGGYIVASVVSFAYFAPLRGLGKAYSVLENNLTQTIASSAAGMSIVAGLAGPIPALALLGHQYPAWALMLWGFGLSCVGVAVAVLRTRLLVTDALPFPTGAATAEVILAMHSGASTALRRARALVIACFRRAFTWLRDVTGLIPAELLLPGTLFGMSLASLSIGVSLSPMTFSTGVLMGFHASWSMLLGSLLGWLLAVPQLVPRRRSRRWPAG